MSLLMEGRRRRLSVPFYRAAGRLYGFARWIERPDVCVECGCDLELSGDCRHCEDEAEKYRIADDAYQQGGEAAFRDARHEFGTIS